jgi:hypothetical protein
MKQVKIIALCMAFCIATLIVLYATSSLNKEIYRGGFERYFANDKDPIIHKTMDLGFNSYYISGIVGDDVYLGNWTAPLHILRVNINTLDTQHVTLKIENLEKINEIKRFRIKVDSPYFYASHGVAPVILRGRIGEWSASPLFKDSIFFDQATPMEKDAVILRSYNTDSKTNELAKQSKTAPIFLFHDSLLQKQIDGILCVDGQTQYNKELKKIIYTYYYRNQYIVCDTNLNLLNRGNTLDTFKTANIKVSTIESKNAKTISAPPQQINVQSCTYDSLLFIRSNIMSKNENQINFESRSTIDVYNFMKSKYLYSFYIDYYKNPLSDFKVSRDKIISIFGSTLKIYRVSNTQQH